MHRLLLPLLALGVLLGGCSESTSPGDAIPPAAPRGLFSITGDHEVTLVWLANTEPDLVGYRIWINQGPCVGGTDCEYVRLDAIAASAGTGYVQYVAHGLENGRTRFFAVSAVDRAGNDSPLSYQDVWDTPRPAGTGLALSNYLVSRTNVGYDFSAFARTNTTDPPTDIFFGYLRDTSGYVYQQVFVPDYATDIQDAGYASSLDAVDFAPDSTEGWSPSGTVEAIVGHNYVVWTRDNHFAKFRITSVSPGQVVFDWAYQIDLGNRELHARPVREEAGSQRRPIVWLHR